MKKFFITILMVLSIAGCQYFGSGTSDDAQEPEREVYEHTESDLIKILQLELGEAKQLEIGEIRHVDHASFGKFLLKDNKQVSEGIFYATDHDGWEVHEVEMFPFDSEVPFTHHTFVASMQDGSNRTFQLVSGYINDDKIKEIHIDYVDGSTSVFKINDEKDPYLDYFIYADDEELNPVQHIVGLDEKGNTVYDYKWSQSVD